MGLRLIVAALCAGAVAQWVRPLPGATLQIRGVRLPGAAPSFAWPSSGEAAATVVGIGGVGQVRAARSVPIAGLAELLAAYVVLSDHRLGARRRRTGDPVTADTLAAYEAGQANQESEVPVAVGESLTELQALEGLLVDSGADMATLLADWDAGSVRAFVAKMNAAASTLGLSSTHIADPSGVDPTTTSTAEDLVRLGEASLSIPVLQQIVSLGEVSVPMTSVVFNLNFDLGIDGIIGIKTASDSSAHGCYLFAAQQKIGGQNVTVVGAVLGQPGGALGPNTAAVDAGDALVRSVFAALHSFNVFARARRSPRSMQRGVRGSGHGGTAGQRDRLARSVATLAVRHHAAQKVPYRAEPRSGRWERDTARLDGVVRTPGHARGPSVWWRLTR